jgi:hypothetical protein
MGHRGVIPCSRVGLEAGLYESTSEVIRAARCALDREKAAMDEIMCRKILASLPYAWRQIRSFNLQVGTQNRVVLG